METDAIRECMGWELSRTVHLRAKDELKAIEAALTAKDETLNTINAMFNTPHFQGHPVTTEGLYPHPPKNRVESLQMDRRIEKKSVIVTSKWYEELKAMAEAALSQPTGKVLMEKEEIQRAIDTLISHAPWTREGLAKRLGNALKDTPCST